ncbi:Ser/Thr protein phosphatase [Tritrichomonas foetus]|uniref:Serine/threonine-protein phosphatase n=1 Tax=Tritrichomonas foetus TaxID=1144522 RepID=A0A1J4JHA5_9EUKA|nr:Ser/Thr protein phosphatase [Tritrichomonas foetus]|eukprot:OHS96987.1 Ser/Thr protein phosphatase [Tritrichomonas foetus]
MEVCDFIINSFQDLISKEPTVCEEEEEDEVSVCYPTFDQQIIFDLLALTIDKLKTGKALIEISHPITIVGDLHGNLADLIKILHIFGTPPSKKYIFLGDFVDRGKYSLAVISLILAYMLKYEDCVYVIRGNHEFMHINRAYGFFDEIMATYRNEEMWIKFQEVFSWFPLAATISQAVFCVHGGLSPLLQDLDTLRELPMPIPNYLTNSMISDLVWSDPVDTVKGFQLNHRGSGQIFGPDVVEQFLRNNKLKLMVRGHQCTLSGFRAFADFMGITVFSSSNYCSAIQNKCGVVTLNSERTISFFSIEIESDYGCLPRAVMSLPVDGDVGLKRIFRTISRPDFRQVVQVQQTESPLAQNDSNTEENGGSSPQQTTITTKISTATVATSSTSISTLNNEESHFPRSMSVIENLTGVS